MNIKYKNDRYMYTMSFLVLSGKDACLNNDMCEFSDNEELLGRGPSTTLYNCKSLRLCVLQDI